MNKQAGFTLLEVMVAVAILAFALAAMVKMSGEGSQSLSYLEKKTIGQWVALNRLNEIKAHGLWPNKGKSSGKVEMAGINWSWEMQINNTQMPDLSRIDVTVNYLQEEQAVYRLAAFLYKPAV